MQGTHNTSSRIAQTIIEHLFFLLFLAKTKNRVCLLLPLIIKEQALFLGLTHKAMIKEKQKDIFFLTGNEALP